MLALAISALAASTPAMATSTVQLISTFPEVVIRKGETEHEWPFSIDEGELTRVEMQGQRYVFFSEILTAEEMGTFGNMTLPRSVVVTANPMAYFATADNRELYAPWDSLETLIKRLAPYERMGRELCDNAGQAPETEDL
ncbi:hypothetical protein [Mesorhizobium sp. CN2-181]|uniref:hypothetical protein n=1 Tax=Mesorhizobium yinganensis TaxID=3157707 RepID=UPI0032B74DFA